MKLCVIGNNFDYELEKLIRLFLPFEKIEVVHELCEDTNLAVCRMDKTDEGARLSAAVTLGGKNAHFEGGVKDDGADFELRCSLTLAAKLFDCFISITGYTPQWGILTGVRPAHLFSRKAAQFGFNDAESYFSNTLRVSKSKIDLCRSAVEGEDRITSLSKPDSFSLYVSIPFCPTRCSYCSFVSHSVDKASEMIPTYINLLYRELEETAKIAKEIGLRLETVYVGGGTPTTFSAVQLDTVLGAINRLFDTSNLREFTVEAGRPDTVSADKLKAIKENGATRISINPQTLNDDVLKAIGRNHTAAEFTAAYHLARSMGFDNINTDLIAGLPLDTPNSFINTLEQIIALSPECVTVHALSMKRASTLTKNGDIPHFGAGVAASQMVDFARERLTKAGILPYYMYRQSKTVGNLENVGYAKAGCEGLYNVYIMDETHTILACGASAVTKLKQPRGDMIERIFNFKYPYEYINRFDEQIIRKQGITEFYKKHKL